ncbi:MAG: peptidase S10 [Alphaproteobacteria bacterium]
MRNTFLVVAALLFVGAVAYSVSAAQRQASEVAVRGEDPAGDSKGDAGGKGEKAAAEPGEPQHFKPEEIRTKGSVNAAGTRVDYTAVAGTLIVHPRGWDDAVKPAIPADKDAKPDKNPSAEASMFFVAYMRNGSAPEKRPITFLYNGGPGSSTVWLHMGAFGPKRVVVPTDSHAPAAPYTLVNNDASLLDASDVVFIDAPGAGFSRIAGKDKEKAFWGVDVDAYAFGEFIAQFIAKYGRWNSPKYLVGESYGTPRSAVLVNQLQSQRSIDFNGIVLVSQILNFEFSPDRPSGTPSMDLPYQLSLPTYAATAWYHKKIPASSKPLAPLLAEVERFALNEYAVALLAGASLPQDRRQAIAQKLNEYTGLPLAYILKADLRIDGGEFRKTLQDDADLTTGRLDTRFSGPTIDPLSQRADYDPQSAAISSAYISALNDYVRKELKYGEGRMFKPSIQVGRDWNFLHQQPGSNFPPMGRQAANVLPDLANAMKTNPNLKVQVHGGYFDLATPYFQSVYEMRHLPMPATLQGNIEFKFYGSGHMMYLKESELKSMHDSVADFIRRTDNVGPK